MATKASDCKCCKCGQTAVAFYPVVDPDIPSHPYCADCLYDAMVELSKVLWKDDKGMQLIAREQAKKAVKKYINKERDL